MTRSAGYAPTRCRTSSSWISTWPTDRLSRFSNKSISPARSSLRRAYDRYALDAFKVNSIDYILKPIKKQELERAFEKFKRLSGREKAEYVEQTQRYLSARAQSFLIPFRDKLVPLTPDEIAYCYTADEKVSVVTFDGRSLPMDKPLDTLIALLPERDFYRANRQFIVSRRAVRDLSVWFGSRLSVNLTVKIPERIVVSKARVPDFKKWFTGN